MKSYNFSILIFELVFNLYKDISFINLKLWKILEILNSMIVFVFNIIYKIFYGNRIKIYIFF